MRGPADGAPSGDETVLEMVRHPLQRRSSCVRRRPVLLHPLLVQSVGALLLQGPPELVQDGDVAVLVDGHCAAVPVLEEKRADDALPAECAPHGHLG